MKKRYFLVFSLLLFLFTFKVNAAVGSMSISGTTLEVGETKTLTIGLSSGIRSADGDVSSSDPSCVQIVSVSSTNGSGYYFNELTMSANDLTSAGRVTIKGLKECSTTIRITRATLATKTDESDGLSFTSGTITVKAKPAPTPTPSDNNNSGNNSGGNTSSNTGSNTNNNSGSNTNTNNNNNTKPSTNTNTNTQPSTNNNTQNNTSSNTNNNNNQKNNDNNKNKENLSKDNNLESLSIDNYDVKFNKNTTNYEITVNYDVESINVHAKAVDNKANVSISGNTSLKYGENNVRVVVTAENGDKKVYTIKVTRTPDPNKNLSSNNNATAITPSIGILSPVFNKDVLDYVIYLPYEVNKITFEVALEDATATLEKEEVENLIVGNNTFKYNVRAENGNIKTYTITVKRAGLFASGNTKLKEIKINDGILIKNTENTYYYTRGKNFSLEVIPEDENAEVKVFDRDGIISIVVEAPNGEYSVYYLLPKSFKKNYVIRILALIIAFVLGFGTYYYLDSNKAKEKKSKKNK